MCQSELHSFLKKLPKCEHHIHLEGALAPSLLFQLASRNEIILPPDDDAFKSRDALLARYKRFLSLDDFLHYYYIGMSVLIHEDDFEALAWDYFRHASSDGVHHAEVFFDPQAHISRGISYSTILNGFNAARSRAQCELGITTELICCFLRHLPASKCLAVFEQDDIQASFANGAIKGIGLDSSELGFPPHLFKDMYEKAAKQGLRRTAHAGEEGPADFITNALEALGVERIDHGIRLADDDELMGRVAANGTMLTVCPLSNVVLKCVGSLEELPIRMFLDAGIKFSINSDDPAYFGGYVLDNYCAVHEAFDLDIGDWERICRSSIKGSWCNTKRKAEMIATLEALVSEWTRLFKLPT